MIGKRRSNAFGANRAKRCSTMRFGMQPLQFADIMNLVAGNGPVDLTKFDFPQLCMSAVKGGFRHIELTLDVSYFLPNSLDEESVERFMEMKEERGITYSVHLPLWSIEPASPNEFVRKASVDSLVHSIEIAKALDPECYVLHSTGALAAEFARLELPESYKGLVNRYMLSCSAKSIGEILQKTKIPHPKLALENVEFPFELTRETVDRFDLSICFDTGHLLAGYCGEQSVMEFVERHWDRIVELHLHDGFHRTENGNKVRRDHLPIGQGNLPVSELMGFLARRGFKGPLVFELALDEAKSSIETIRKKCPWVLIEQ